MSGRSRGGEVSGLPQIKHRALLSVLLVAVTLGLLTTAVALAAAGDISTVAGKEISAFGGDGGPATSASLSSPLKVAVDSSGNLFIADSSSHVIRKVDTSGNISTVAGTTAPTFGGDGGPATSAHLNFPSDVAVDFSGNLFIADRNNHRVRKVDTSGNISTVAGTGNSGFSGDGGPATSAQLQAPRGIVADSSGNLFIADSGNSRIRKVDTSGNVSTVAGTGTSDPRGVAVDSSGNLFIADSGNSRIRKVDTSGNVSTVAGTATGGFSGDGGPATNAQLGGPWGVVVDSSGNLFIADTFNERIRKVDTSGNISTVAGTGTHEYGGDGGPATSAQLSFPSGVAVDSSGNLFIADSSNHRIRKVEAVAAAAPTPTPTPTPVPGVSTTGLIGLAVLMAGAGVFAMVRRRPEAH